MELAQWGLLALGLTLLIAGADRLVRGAAGVAIRWRISPLVIGLTVVAFGTSSPELAVSLRSALSGQADIAVGNVVGSNIFNVLLILGLSALLVPLRVAAKLVRLDVPLMILVSLAFLVLAGDGRVGRLEGVALVAAGILYTAFLYWEGRREGSHGADAPTATLGVGSSLLLVALGLLLLGFGARLLVDSATVLARALGVSEATIALTVVAAGTSLPEVATSVVASLRGERDLAVGNVVGSNIFNILWVLGIASAVAPNGVAVSSEVLRFDLPVMVAVAVACLPIFFTGFFIERWEGALFLGYYAAYLSFLLLAAQRHAALPAFSGTMLWGVLPLTAVTLALLSLRSWRAAVASRHEDS